MNADLSTLAVRLGQSPLNPQAIPDDVLLEGLATERLAAEEAHIRADRLEQEAMRRMRERGATSIPSEAFLCELLEKVDYDQSRLVQLRERPVVEGWDAAWVQEHEETKVIPGKYDVRKVAAIARKVGFEAQRIVEEARVVQRQSLKFEAREK